MINNNELWTNPLVENKADPWVLKHENMYYFAATSPEYDRIEIRQAKTIGEIGRSKPDILWSKHVDGVMSHHIWAPEIHYINDTWYIFFAAGRSEDVWRIRMYVLECKDSNPNTGRWIEKGEIVTKFDSFSLDGTVFEYKNKWYLVWAQHDPSIQSNTNLYIDELINPWTLSGHQVMISNPEHDWEKVGFSVNEGPAVLSGDNHIYITYSASKTDSNYCMGLLTMEIGDNPLNPDHWVKKKHPVFTSSEKNSQYGPGHNCFVTLDDHRVVMIYHARNYKEIQGDPLQDMNRHTRAQFVNMTKSGIEFGEPVADGLVQ